MDFKLENNTAALAAFDKLVADFNDHRDLFQTISEIGMESQDPKAGKYDLAKAIFNKVLTDYPGTKLAFKAQKNLAVINLEEGDYTAAQEAFDTLITDFNDHPDLPQVVFTVGRQYYLEALQDEKQELNEQNKVLFQKAIDIWDRIITQFPNADEAPQAYFMSGVCYRDLGEDVKSTECFQKIVNEYPDYMYAWEAKFMIEHNVRDVQRWPQSIDYSELEK